MRAKVKGLGSMQACDTDPHEFGSSRLVMFSRQHVSLRQSGTKRLRTWPTKKEMMTMHLTAVQVEVAVRMAPDGSEIIQCTHTELIPDI